MTSVAPGGIERRQHPRVPFCANAVISQEERGLGSAGIQNLSVEGALLVAEFEPPLGSLLQMTITSGKLKGASFRAEVRWAVVGADLVRFGVRILLQETAIAGLIQGVVLEELERAGQETGAE
jgi:hypothetical protein